MKRKEKSLKEFVLEKIDFLTNGALNTFKKIGKLSNSKKTHDTVFMFTKIAITLILIAVMYIPFEILGGLGKILIYSFGSTFRGILSMNWSFVVNSIYCVISLIILLEVLNGTLKNKELNFIEDNKRKDTIIKKKIFLPVIKVVSVILYLFTIPFICISAIVLTLLGACLALLVNGYVFISGLIILIGILVMAVSFILAISKVANGGVNDD